jgi:hypothetical protein
MKIKAFIEKHAMSILSGSAVTFFAITVSPVFLVLLGFVVGLFYWERLM